MSNAITTAPTALAAAAAVTTRPVVTSPADELAALRAQLAAANAEKDAANARLAAAEAKRIQPGKITATVKAVVKDKDGKDAPGKGGIQIYGVNSKFPATFYLQTLVKMLRTMKEDGIIRKAVEENMAHVSVRLPGATDAVRCVTPEAIEEARRALAELDELLGVQSAG